MQASTFAKLTLSLSLLLATACGGAHKRAESPDPTDTGWSGASTDGAQAKAGPSIQSTPPKTDDPAKVVASNAPSTEAGDKPEAMSQAEADVVAGRTLPTPPRADKPEKPVKPKKPAVKTRKKASKKTA